ncbi:zinc metalloprotease [Actinomadura hibisca]|uniref:zinc metalloprotease n=1 Tax=Actinomadura hibisca TaxID=68565 RepID=UPI00082F8AF1|nr:zinc metalloprotease [Actinomadura hibisca]
MERAIAASLCALSATFCIAAASWGDHSAGPTARPGVAAARDCVDPPLAGRGAHAASNARSTRGESVRRDGADLDRHEVLAMLDDLRRTMRDRLGIDDESLLDLGRLFPGQRRTGRIEIPVRFHVIADGAAGALPRAAAERQVATLDDAYSGRTGGADVGVSFRLVSYEVTDNARWFREPERYEGELKTALHQGGPDTLNLYSAAVGADVLGFSTFPQWYRKKPAWDGVVVDYRSLPGGSYRNFDRGYTAVHETGHWLGLFHTFENGCEPPGDGIDDTPYEAEPAEGCPSYKDTCSQPGSDPVHNFMNYGWDDCMQEFTAGQARRVRTVWAAYRAAKPNVRKAPLAAGGARTVGGAG